MMHEISESIRKRSGDNARSNLNTRVVKCPRDTCNGFGFPPLMQCTLCLHNIFPGDTSKGDTSSGLKNGQPAVKQPRLLERQISAPILILSVGKMGIFDARHRPCTISPNDINFHAKVDSTWCPITITAPEVQTLLFCEDLQVLFLRPGPSLKTNLISCLQLSKNSQFDPNSLKWVILVLGDRMSNSPHNNVSISQMESFATYVRSSNGYCKMDCTLLEMRRLLLECGLRLPRAEARLLSQTTTNPNGSQPIATATAAVERASQCPLTNSKDNVPFPKSATSTAKPVTVTKQGDGLLTNVLNSLSSAGMHFLNQTRTTEGQPSISITTSASPPIYQTEDESDDLIILSAENDHCDRPTSAKQQSTPTTSITVAGLSASSNATKVQTQPSEQAGFKLDYQPTGSTDSVTLTKTDIDCLVPGGLLNDAIINFYLKYLYFEQLSDVQRRSTYLFNCFFYSRLTGTSSVASQLSTPNPPTGSTTAKSSSHSPGSATTRHANVAKWTRRVDLFCKDYIIIPINEASHWFLGLVCYPWMAGMVSYTALYRAAAYDLCQLTEQFADVDQMQFGKDVDDEMISSEPVERRPSDTKGIAFDRWRRRRLSWLRKRGINAMPCILLFDSLPCQTRVSNLHVLRDYLQVEWDSRRSSQDGPLHFNKDTIRGFSPRVPSQSNLVDCGIYLLHYVEMFFKKPVQSYTKDYFQNEMARWFTDDTLSQKRTDIQNLLLQMNKEQQQQ